MMTPDDDTRFDAKTQGRAGEKARGAGQRDRATEKHSTRARSLPGLRAQRLADLLSRQAVLWLLLALFWPPTTWAIDPSQHAEGRASAAARAVAPFTRPALRALPDPVVAVAAVGMTVADVDRSVDFYSQVLSFEKVSDVEVSGIEYERLQAVFGLRMRVVRMRLGDEFIELTEYLAPKGRPIPVDSRSNDRWFQHIAIITGDMDQAYELLRRNRVEHASSGPQRLPDWNKNAGGIKAFYFRDPDKHPLEILQFPPGKGDPKWHRPTDKLFLGIDHTAIVVGDTEASLRFYRDALGLKVTGESENYGTEQEHLNNVFGARLRITSLRAAAGPGIEFLEYFSPRDGRPTPLDKRANDLIHWQTSLVTTDAARAAQSLLAERYGFVSSGLILTEDKKLGFKKGFLVHDPDGHVMQLIER